VDRRAHARHEDARGVIRIRSQEIEESGGGLRREFRNPEIQESRIQKIDLRGTSGRGPENGGEYTDTVSITVKLVPLTLPTSKKKE
jgi:hypothetical protein